jgi:hypothetical protein
MRSVHEVQFGPPVDDRIVNGDWWRRRLGELVSSDAIPNPSSGSRGGFLADCMGSFTLVQESPRRHADRHAGHPLCVTIPHETITMLLGLVEDPVVIKIPHITAKVLSRRSTHPCVVHSAISVMRGLSGESTSASPFSFCTAAGRLTVDFRCLGVTANAMTNMSSAVPTGDPRRPPDDAGRFSSSPFTMVPQLRRAESPDGGRNSSSLLLCTGRYIRYERSDHVSMAPPLGSWPQ